MSLLDESMSLGESEMRGGPRAALAATYIRLWAGCARFSLLVLFFAWGATGSS